MSKQALQQRLTQQSGLLASQQQLLQRLLLQLEFNQPDRLQLVGGSGSGKSTLLLALAEICSEQFNVALVQGDYSLAPVDLLKVLQQQWFGSLAMPRTLADFTAQLDASKHYLLLVDDADQLSDDSWQLIQQLPVSVFVTSLKANSAIRLAMNIPAFSEEEAASLLLPYQLSGREQRERIEDCAGDLHLLLHGLNASAARKTMFSKPKSQTNQVPLAFSAPERVEPPVFVNTQVEPGFDLNSGASAFTLRATDDTDQPTAFQIETEQRSDYRSRTVQDKKAAKQASGQFFSPFLVMSLGFGLIAAVVMFWLWTEQQFRQPVASDMVPYYPSASENSPESRLQQRQFEPTVKIEPEVISAVDQVKPATSARSGQDLPAMALEKTSDAASMTIQQEVAKDDNGLPQQQIVSMTIESEPMREQPVITLPAAGADTEQVEATDEPAPEAKAEPKAEPAAEQNDLVAEMEADVAQSTPGSAAKTTSAAGNDAAVLLDMLPDTVAIQLGVFSQEAAAQKFLQQYAALNLKLYQRNLQGKVQFVVVSASYVNAAAAKQQVKSLPEELRQQTPFVKPLGDIQREIRAANAN